MILFFHTTQYTEFHINLCRMLNSSKLSLHHYQLCKQHNLPVDWFTIARKKM